MATGTALRTFLFADLRDYTAFVEGAGLLLDHVTSAGARLPYAGGIEETATQHRLFFEDPDRIKVEVVAPRLAAPASLWAPSREARSPWAGWIGRRG